MTACIVCDRSDATPLWRVGGFDVVRCGCGLVRTELPEGYDPTAIYTDEYFQGGHSDGYADYQGSRETLQREFARTVDALVARGVTGGRLLELGCAYGYFLDEARKRFEVCGVEVAAGARASCRERGLDVVERLTPEFVARHGPFDAVVMLDVIEHLDDPGAVLATVREAMRPGAVLLITTGDVGALSARLLGSRWRLMTPPQHLWFFSGSTLRALLARHGFTVESTTHPWKLVPLQLVAYQASRAIGAQGLLKGRQVPGSLPINLFDAMRVIARRD